jgi:hypothetical protein
MFDVNSGEYRRCANGEVAGCLMLLVAFLAGFLVHWIVQFP